MILAKIFHQYSKRHAVHLKDVQAAGKLFAKIKKDGQQRIKLAVKRRGVALNALNRCMGTLQTGTPGKALGAKDRTDVTPFNPYL